MQFLIKVKFSLSILQIDWMKVCFKDTSLGLQSHSEDLVGTIYFETYLKYLKYTLSRLSKVMYLSSHSEVYLKQNFNIDVFILELCNILSKFMYLCANSDVYLK